MRENPDWKHLVRKRLDPLNLRPDEKEEVIAELAAHLEDSRGADLEIAWGALAHTIERVKREEKIMNQRTKTLWMPVFLNLSLSSVMLIVLSALGIEGIAPRHPNSFTIHPWLIALPLCAAMAALAARRARASLVALLVAGMAPALLWLVVFSLVGLVLVCDPRHFSGVPLDSFVVAAFSWIVLPAVPLFLGMLPFLRQRNLRHA
jgi:hypothetical protein